MFTPYSSLSSSKRDSILSLCVYCISKEDISTAIKFCGIDKLVIKFACCAKKQKQNLMKKEITISALEKVFFYHATAFVNWIGKSELQKMSPCIKH